jgi:hypothetical protein
MIRQIEQLPEPFTSSQLISDTNLHYKVYAVLAFLKACGAVHSPRRGQYVRAAEYRRAAAAAWLSVEPEELPGESVGEIYASLPE